MLLGCIYSHRAYSFCFCSFSAMDLKLPQVVCCSVQSMRAFLPTLLLTQCEVLRKQIEFSSLFKNL